MAAVIAAVAPEGLIGAEAPVDVQERARRFRDSIEAGAPSGHWVLEEDGRVVGSADVEQRVPGVFTLGMAILPEFRGRGRGRMLLDRALAHARDCGGHKLALEVWPENGRAIALYARAGFEVEGLRRDHYRRLDGRLRSSLMMARRLDRAS
jgi:putative acetyltransferase